MIALVLAAALAMLPTGRRLDPAAPAHAVGNFPLSMVLSPEKDKLVLLLSGWRQQGLQVVDRKTGEVLQTIDQPSAFLGLAFSPDGKSLYASGGDDDLIVRYDWNKGIATPAGAIVLAEKPDKKKFGARYAAGMAFSRDGRFLFAAENLGDALAVIDVKEKRVVQRLPVDRYPYAVAVADDGSVYVSCWGGDTVFAFAMKNGKLAQTAKIAAEHHPSAMALRGQRLYVVSASTDRIAVIDTKLQKMVKTLTDAPVAGVREGSTPNAVSISDDGKRLFVAEADNNAVAVFSLPEGKLLGRMPVEWYPTALLADGGDLFVANGKGAGSAPNPGRNQPDRPLPEKAPDYTLGQIRGSVMTLDAKVSAAGLQKLTTRVGRANGWSARVAARYPPFKHVIYILKENRTYDQVLGDVAEGDGDASLVFFGRDVTPNHHALAQRFGLFDRFFVNAEVSAQGHNWSMAAYSTDYNEKTTPSAYAQHPMRSYDAQGTNREKVVEPEDDVSAPAAGYLWDAALKKGITLRNFGEWTVEPTDVNPPIPSQTVPARALREHTNLDFPGFDLDISDQVRVDVWQKEFDQWVAKGEMPQLQIVWLPCDHTAGTTPGKHTPRAFAADNDLALGRVVYAVTKSPFWKDTAIFVLEDDAQSGPDHVDSHRSVLLVISPYSRGGVVHRFVNTTDVVATIEEILGIDPISQFDRFGHPLNDVFGPVADLRPFVPVTPDVDRTAMNPEEKKESASLDFSRPDAVDDETLNRILWAALKGDRPYPGVRRAALSEMLLR